jgi:hypothetical protein
LRGIQVFVEGGGAGKNATVPFRRGLGAFLGELREAARKRSLRWSIIPCGPRGRAFADFRRACRVDGDCFNVLLVDSEGPVSASPREHLRQADGWPIEQAEQHYHLMVQAMEAWIIADVEALRAFYGQGFRESAIPVGTDVEQIDKDRLVPVLERASRGTQKGSYHKIRHAGGLLARLSPDVVRQRAQHCERPFATLLGVIAAQDEQTGAEA